ncbi:unnamed protein product [Brassica oleracea]|uniref:(rape) hypothetical protein n=1 Tax=Brassica napus TaxID=3708 RepID=A0A816J383_BRANA|nr:unnamed protein product [Brassica napus]
MIPHLLPRPSPSRLRRIGSIRLVQSVQDPAQGQELLLRHVLLLQRRHEDVHPRRQPSAARLLSFDQGNNNKASIFGSWVFDPHNKVSISVTRLSSPPPWNQAFLSPDLPPSCSRSGRESS